MNCGSKFKLSNQMTLSTSVNKSHGFHHNELMWFLNTNEFFQLFFFFYSHYAGDVTYAITGFMDKNKDSLWQDLKRLLYNSTNKSLSDMWPEGGTNIQKVGSTV